MEICKFLNDHYIPIIVFIGSLLIYGLLCLAGYTIDVDAYFYTLSTISQTLAALIGVLGLVIIFQLQTSKSNEIKNINQLKVDVNQLCAIQSKAQESTGDPESNDEVGRVLKIIDSSNNDQQFVETSLVAYNEVNSKPSPPEVFNPFFATMRNIEKDKTEYENFKKLIKESLSFPMLIAIVAISLSIIFLPCGRNNVEDQNIYPRLILCMVGLVVSMTLAAICALVQSAYELLKPEILSPR